LRRARLTKDSIPKLRTPNVIIRYLERATDRDAIRARNLYGV
jgi:hypothetical protein